MPLQTPCPTFPCRGCFVSPVDCPESAEPRCVAKPRADQLACLQEFCTDVRKGNRTHWNTRVGPLTNSALCLLSSRCRRQMDKMAPQQTIVGYLH